MPITPAQWDAAVDEQLSATARPVLAFLKANNLAYTAAEVSSELGLDPVLVRTALENLCEEGVLDGGVVDSATYFLYRR